MSATNSVSPLTCAGCPNPATVETRAWGEPVLFCGACSAVPSDCVQCGEMPDRAGRCDCPGGGPTMPTYARL